MDDFHEPLVEAHSRLKGVILGLCCIVTLIAFIYVLYKVFYAPNSMPKLELSIVLLSCVQLSCGVLYYLFTQNPFLHVFNKGVKVAQCELISWSCIAILLSLKPVLKGLLSAFFVIFTAILLFVIAFASIHVIPSTIYFNAKLGIVVSLLWFLMSCSVLHVAFLIRRNLDLFSPGRLAIASDNHLDSFTKTKFQHFMLLSLVEFVAATGTLVWDVLVYYSLHPSHSGSVVELSMPVLSEILHVLSNILIILLPNWTIFYTFFWLQKGNYSRINVDWDVNIQSAFSNYMV